MNYKTKLNELFNIQKPIIGMIHLAGNNEKEKIIRALEELTIYEEGQVNGAIIEDYHGEMYDVYDTLKEAVKLNYNLVLGVNVLRNPYLGLNWADALGGKFAQFDSVQSNNLSEKHHKIMREKYSNVLIFGGIRFKYTAPSNKTLEQDLKEGMSRCDAIVTTGEGTGIETPIEKLQQFNNYLKEFPLIVGAGLNASNAYKQLQIADGAIVGSFFKPNKNTCLPVDKYLVRDLMDIVKEARKDNLEN
jgi:hypothetical protein